MSHKTSFHNLCYLNCFSLLLQRSRKRKVCGTLKKKSCSQSCAFTLLILRQNDCFFFIYFKRA